MCLFRGSVLFCVRRHYPRTKYLQCKWMTSWYCAWALTSDRTAWSRGVFFCSHFSDVASCCSLSRSQCRMFNLAWHCFTKWSHQRAIKIVFPLLISSRKECGWNTELYFSQSPPKQRMEVFHGGQGGLNKVTQPLQVQPFIAQNITFKTSIVNELRISGRCLKAA